MTITDAGLDRPSVVGGGSVYPAVQNLLLACRNEGLGCVLTTLLCVEEEKVKALLDIPEDWYTAASELDRIEGRDLWRLKKESEN